MTDDEKLEKIARELCLAAGRDPDAKVRLGQPLSFAAGDCTIVKPLIVPAWKAYCREARRLSMSDAEHAEPDTAKRKSRRTRRIARWRAAPRLLRIVLRRRLARMSGAVVEAGDIPARGLRDWNDAPLPGASRIKTSRKYLRAYFCAGRAGDVEQMNS